MAILVSSSWVAGCDGCDGPPAALRVEGDHPYVRCVALDPPEERTARAGGVSLSLEGRRVTVEAPSDGPLRVAAFPGAAPLRHSVASFMEQVAAARPHLVFVVGDVGDTEQRAQVTLTEVASAVEVPVLVMAGGRDDATVLGRALDGLPGAVTERVIDARGLWLVRHAGAEMVLVSGAPGGRYARTDAACGFGPEDLEAMGEALDGQSRRVMLSWAGPAGFGAPGLGGRDGGSAPLGAFAEDYGVAHAAFAWPEPGRDMHFAADPRNRGRWLPSPPPVPDEVTKSMILMGWDQDGLRRGLGNK